MNDLPSRETETSAVLHERLIDGLSVGFAFTGKSSRVRARHLDRALALALSSSFQIDALPRALARFALTKDPVALDPRSTPSAWNCFATGVSARQPVLVGCDRPGFKLARGFQRSL